MNMKTMPAIQEVPMTRGERTSRHEGSSSMRARATMIPATRESIASMKKGVIWSKKICTRMHPTISNPPEICRQMWIREGRAARLRRRG